VTSPQHPSITPSGIRGLIVELRRCGWRHTVTYQKGTYEQDGTPNADHTWEHVWTRGDQVIRTWLDDHGIVIGVEFGPADDDGSEELPSVHVGVHWIRRHGLLRLWMLAHAMDLTVVAGGQVLSDAEFAR
jgi:hypothetical protein